MAAAPVSPFLVAAMEQCCDTLCCLPSITTCVVVIMRRASCRVVGWSRGVTHDYSQWGDILTARCAGSSSTPLHSDHTTPQWLHWPYLQQL